MRKNYFSNLLLPSVCLFSLFVLIAGCKCSNPDTEWWFSELNKCVPICPIDQKNDPQTGNCVSKCDADHPWVSVYPPESPYAGEIANFCTPSCHEDLGFFWDWAINACIAAQCEEPPPIVVCNQDSDCPEDFPHCVNDTGSCESLD